MTELHLSSASQAEEAGFLAMRDIAAVADGAGIEYRIVGGQMVRLHVALAGVAEPVVRVTQDADMGIAAASARNPALVSGLQELGYTGPGASNRFVREADGLMLVIDVLAPPGVARWCQTSSTATSPSMRSLDCRSRWLARGRS